MAAEFFTEIRRFLPSETQVLKTIPKPRLAFNETHTSQTEGFMRASLKKIPRCRVLKAISLRQRMDAFERQNDEFSQKIKKASRTRRPNLSKIGKGTKFQVLEENVTRFSHQQFHKMLIHAISCKFQMPSFLNSSFSSARPSQDKIHKRSVFRTPEKTKSWRGTVLSYICFFQACFALKPTPYFCGLHRSWLKIVHRLA